MGRELSCGVEFMRGVLLFFNVLFVIVGLALIGLGIYIKVDDNFASILSKLADESTTFQGQSLGFLAFVMIGSGVFTLLIALFGCMGALWNNRCLLYMYALILALLMILELVGFIMAFVYKSKLKDVYTDSLSTALTDAITKNQTDVLSSFRDLENSMKCCGVHNVSDYNDYPQSQLSQQCKDHPDSQGCSAAIIGFLNKHLPIIGGSLGGVLLLELLGLIGAIVLAKALKNKPDHIVVRGPRRR
ncbi:unnamed protein product [Adineta steineri]|uniref:Tetraspanin n=1 Tax=Adineta steineri TaxID=433720 RepID=A0A819FH02_9BILA|nr:unnamed protein product [Adineta steineri]CAF1441215.1 unnamed protein product [Adineta steineri]CAF3868534.1 unnamed protein product [Adineta steineri]CAF4187354.1 unnamed protein product [Adineta steineri]